MFTQNGRILFEVASAIQKEIRRGNEEQALYWALELLPRYEKYLWKRLIIIANEDIGIANCRAVEFVTNQCAAWFRLREMGAQTESILILANAILAMCRSPKCRLADHLLCVCITHWQDEERDIPDYALDKHTLRGKQLGRGMQFFLDNEDDLLKDTSAVFDPYRDEARELWLNNKPSKSAEWAKPKKTESAEQGELF